MWSINNRANQLNPNNIAYWTSRGFKSIPTALDGWRIFSLIGNGTVVKYGLIGISSYIIYRGVQKHLPVVRETTIGLYNYFNNVYLPTIVYVLHQTYVACLHIYAFGRIHLPNTAIGIYSNSIWLVKSAGSYLKFPWAISFLISANPNVFNKPQPS